MLVTLLLTAITLDRNHNADTADRISDSSAVLKQLVRLRSALFRERLADEILVPSRRPPAELLETTDFGFQLVNDAEGMEHETDDGPRRPDGGPATVRAGLLDRMRLEPLGGLFAGGRMVTRLDDLDRRVVDRISRHLAIVSETSVDLGSGSLIGKARALQRSVGIPDQAGTLVAALVDLWSSPAEGRSAKQSAVADAAARLDTLSDLMTSTIVDPTTPSPELFSVTSVPPWEFRDAVASALRGELSDPSREAGQPPTVGSRRWSRSTGWSASTTSRPTPPRQCATASLHVVRERPPVGPRGDRHSPCSHSVPRSRRAVLFGRSIARPVRRFSDQALAVGRGRLDVEPLDLAGRPRSCRASQSFNVMVGNLVLLERKSQALADSDFQHPSLSAPLPGLLGASLQRSIEVLSDSIEEREQLQHRLAFEATHDPLTGLANRAALIEQLHRMQLIAQRTGGSVAVIFIDLDDFKRVNDRHGHAVGDELLRTVALRMQQELPASGILARLGGDEFVCALPAVADPREAITVAHRLVAAVIEPLMLDDMRLKVGASAGRRGGRVTSRATTTIPSS